MHALRHDAHRAGSRPPRAIARALGAAPILAALAGALLAVGCAHVPAEPPVPMAGRWRDDACQARPTQYPIRNIFVRRDFEFEPPGGAWRVDARFFSDAACTVPVFTLHVRGRYRLTGPATMPDAWNGTFAFDRRAVTPYSREAVEAFAAARCGGGAPVAAGREIDVSTTGCAPALSRPIAEAGQEYDLAQVDGGRLRFGARTAQMDRPEGRPSQLSPFWLSRLP